MKISLLCLFLGLESSFAIGTYSQETLFTISVKQQSVKEVFNYIEKNSEFIIFYWDKNIDLNRRVSINIKNQSVENILSQLFTGTDLTYTINDRQIIISKGNKKSNIKTTTTVLRQKEITGKVVDAQGEPIIGANVIVKGTTNGTVTDIDGKFSLQVSEGETLVVSYLGYIDYTIKIKDQKSLSIILAEDNKSLDEVVVVGYGTLKKSDLTGSVSSISSEVFENVGTANFASSLSGKVSGLQVIQNSGVPGGGVTMRIRGSNSMGDSEPLYIVDGVPYDNSDIAGFETEGSAISPISMINPSDIESMEVLKDASATAIYGSRASNGVVIVTTKSGKKGAPRVNIDFDYSFSKLFNRIDLLDANEYYIVKNEANINGGKDPLPEETIENALAGKYTTYDWQDILFKTGKTMNVNTSLSGGSENLRYMSSINYMKSNGIVPKTDFSRLSGRINIDTDINKYFKAGFVMNFSRITTDGLPSSTGLHGGQQGTNSVISRALRVNPNVDPNSDNITSYDPNSDTVGEIEDYSPLMAINGITQKNKSLQLRPSMYITYDIIKGLQLKTTVNYNYRQDASRYYQSRNMPYGYSEGGWARTKDSNFYSLTNENTLSFNRQINKNHRINAVAGMSVQVLGNETITNSVKGFPNDHLLWHDLSSGANQEPSSNGEAKTNMISWFARINYSLLDRYLFTFTGRVDGCSKFADNNKYGVFPSGAFAWRMNQEKWMRKFENLSNLKLRLSYGITGNQAIAAYKSLLILNSQSAIFGEGQGEKSKYIGYTYPSNLPNANLKWETTGQVDAGLDIGLFNNRLEFVVDYYNKQTKDLLVSAQIPKFTGYSTSLLNFGKMSNQGWEIAINGTPFDNKDLTWNTGLNFSFNKTMIKKLEKDYFDSGMRIPWKGFQTQILIEGEKLGTFWGYKRDGIRQIGEEAPKYKIYGKPVEVGDQKYCDLNNDGLINADDKTKIGNAQPLFTFGFNNTLNFKAFDLTVFIDGSYGNDICNVNAMQGLEFGMRQQFREVLKRWTPENPTNEYPRLNERNNQTSFMYSDRYIEDGSFIRLQNVTLGYKLPNKWVKHLGLSSLRLYFSANNICTISGYSGYSPDVSLSGRNNLMMGHDNGGYPNPTSFKMGINIGI